MKINEILKEAGEPANPSRRGFLKALGAAGIAAAAPGVAAKALSTPAAAEVPAAAAAAAEADVIPLLWRAATAFGAQHGVGFDYAWVKPKDPNYPGDDAEWEPGENDLATEPSGEYGDMPWGSPYEINTTPAGHKVLITTHDDEYITYTFEKDGRAYSFKIYPGRYGEVWKLIDTDWDPLWKFDVDAYEKAVNSTRQLDDQDFDLSVVDAIMDGSWQDYTWDKTEKSNDRVEPANTNEPTPSKNLAKDTETGTTAADLARLAGLAKRGYDAAQSAGEPKQPPTAEPKQLPTPEKPDIDLTPDLKQKQQEPAKKKPNES